MSKALIIIDIQNDYFEGGKMTLSGAEEAAKNARKLLDHFREEKLQVIHVKHLSIRPGSTFFQPKTRGAEIHESVSPAAEEKVITKYFPNAFIRTDLHDFLKVHKLKDLVICGMMTHMCVDATVRAAKDLGFNITLIWDACATRQLEVNGQSVEAVDVHNSFLAALNSYYAEIQSVDDYLENCI